MQVQQTLIKHQSGSKSNIKLPPTTIRELFESEQYKLATSGFSTPVISILINNPKLHQELIDAMLLIDRPHQINIPSEEDTLEEEANLPFRVYDLFLNFEDVYRNYMFGFNGAIELENNGRELLERMFSIFSSESVVDETAVGYLCGIVEQVLLKIDTTMFLRFIISRVSILEGISHHLDCPAVSNMILKSLESGSEETSPEAKVEIVRTIFVGCMKNISIKVLHNAYPLQGLKYLVQNILEKSSTRKLGSHHLSEYLVSKEISELVVGVLNDPAHSVQTHESCLEILIILLKQFRESEDAPNKGRGSISKAKGLFKVPKKTRHKLSLDSIQLLVFSISKHLVPLTLTPFNATKQRKTFSLLFIQLLELMAIYIPQQLKPLLTLQFLTWMLLNMANVPHCNLYHNSVKEVINMAIADEELSQSLLTSDKFNLFDFFHSHFIRKFKTHCFGSHLYQFIHSLHVKVDGERLQEAVERGGMQEQWNEIRVKYEEMRESRKRRYEDAADSDVDQEELRLRARSIGSETILPVIQSMELTQKVSATQTQAQSQISHTSPQKLSVTFSPPHAETSIETMFSSNSETLFPSTQPPI